MILRFSFAKEILPDECVIVEGFLEAANVVPMYSKKVHLSADGKYINLRDLHGALYTRDFCFFGDAAKERNSEKIQHGKLIQLSLRVRSYDECETKRASARIGANARGKRTSGTS